MSTYWYFECQQHDPAISSEDGLNHGKEELAELLAAFKAGEIPRTNYVRNHIEVNVLLGGTSWPWHFLMGHPDCKIGIVSEYGDKFVDEVVYRRDGSIFEGLKKS